MDTTEPTWIRTDGEVAVSDGGTYAPRIEFKRIARITDTQIILHDGRRFRRTGSRSQLHTTSPSSLHDPRSAHVVQAYARQLVSEYRHQVGRLTDGSAATLHTMSPRQVGSALRELDDHLHAAREALHRRIRNAEDAGTKIN